MQLKNLLRIYIKEGDKHEGRHLYEWLLVKAREHGLAGATAWRGMTGFGASRVIHTTKIVELSLDLPIMIDVIDDPDKIAEFVNEIKPIVGKGMIFEVTVRVHLHDNKE